jgi:phthalate 4,5-dioxygenase
LLCRVEGDAPMGALMRRHWQAICLQEEVSEPDGTPVRARVLEKIWLFFVTLKVALAF